MGAHSTSAPIGICAGSRRTCVRRTGGRRPLAPVHFRVRALLRAVVFFAVRTGGLARIGLSAAALIVVFERLFASGTAFFFAVRRRPRVAFPAAGSPADDSNSMPNN